MRFVSTDLSAFHVVALYPRWYHLIRQPSTRIFLLCMFPYVIMRYPQRPLSYLSVAALLIEWLVLLCKTVSVSRAIVILVIIVEGKQYPICSMFLCLSVLKLQTLLNTEPLSMLIHLKRALPPSLITFMSNAIHGLYI